ncbi:hypothetical protein HPB52_013224 [Rhipicephalus sanguineus]|uniref:Uncharacterized protein n=1 Tax=Rhipicephalus sanguineus TaxID=34632 RepID=A0A9D4Q991_RHISA|nr:hypothetical protein HPB52_013224 [Rhipicephalus sanguineus]
MVVVIVLSAAAVGIIIKRRSARRPAGHTATDCTTTSCLEYKERFHDAMDDDEDPCDNFYKYVCGAWIDVQDTAVSVPAKFWTDFIAEVASKFESVDAPKEQQASVQKAAAYLQACLGVLKKSNVAGVKSILTEAGIVWPERNPKPDFLNAVFFMSTGAIGVAIENEAYVDAVFELHEQYGEAVMNDVVETLCIQNLVSFTDVTILESFYGNSESVESAVRGSCFSVSYNTFGYAINYVFLRSNSVPYQEVVRFAENISREIPLLLRGNSSLLEKSKSRNNFERMFHVLNMSQPGFYPQIYEQYPDMTENPLANLIHVLNATKMHYKGNVDTFLHYDYKEIDFKDFVLTIPDLLSPVYSSNAHWAIRYGGVGARIAATVFCDYVEGSDNAQQIYRKNQDCLSNQTGDKIDVNLQAAIASAAIAPALYEKERAKAKANDPLFMNIWPLKSEQIPFVFGCYLMCGLSGGEKMCNVPFKHSVNFARAFKCAEGSPMNPKKKCWMLPA